MTNGRPASGRPFVCSGRQQQSEEFGGHRSGHQRHAVGQQGSTVPLAWCPVAAAKKCRRKDVVDVDAVGPGFGASFGTGLFPAFLRHEHPVRELAVFDPAGDPGVARHLPQQSPFAFLEGLRKMRSGEVVAARSGEYGAQTGLGHGHHVPAFANSAQTAVPRPAQKGNGMELLQFGRHL